MEDIEKLVYGITKEHAIHQRICLSCRISIDLTMPKGSIHDYSLTGFCPVCYQKSISKDKLKTNHLRRAK